MKQIEINGTVRNELGKKAARAIRKEGLVPCVMYGEQKDADNKPVATSFTITYEEARKLLFTPDIYLVNASIDGNVHTVIIQDAQFHPVKDTILHIDFYEVHTEKPIVMAVPIQTTGLAIGVKAGGRLSVAVRKLKVKATYDKIPEKLTIDVTNLNLGKSIKAGELSFEGLELVTPKEVVVCTVKTTRAAQSNAAAAAAAN
jgi:large subunit ribosomal protein L25